MRSRIGGLTIGVFFVSSAIIAIFSFFLHATDCDFEARSPVTALTGIVRTSLDNGDLKLSQLEKSIAGEIIENPFKDTSRDIKNLSARQAFARHVQLLSQVQTENYIASIRHLIQTQHGLLVSVDAAKKRTADILGFGKPVELPHIQDGSHFVSGIVDGRPVFLGRLQIQQQSYTAMIDHLHPDPAKQLLLLANHPQGDFQTQFSGEVIRWHNQDCFVDSHNFKIFDLNTGLRTELNPQSPLCPPPHLVGHVSSTFLKSSDSFQIISQWDTDQKSFTTPLTVNAVDILKSGREGHDFLKLTVDRLGSLKTHKLDGHVILPTAARDNSDDVSFYDLSDNQKLIAKLDNDNGRRTFRMALLPLPFSLKGHWLAYARYYTWQPSSKFWMGLFDLSTGQLLRNVSDDPRLTSLQATDYLEVDGHPYAIFYFDSSVKIFDMESEKALWQINGKMVQNYALFKWLGEAHILFWSAERSDIEMRNLKTGKLEDKISLPGPAIPQILPFMDGERPKAFLSRGKGQHPLILPLGISEQHSRQESP